MTQPKLYSTSKAGYMVVLLCFLLVFKAKSQEVMDAPEAKLLTRFKFEMLSGGIVILQARLDDYADTLNFILDTGSGGISLDSLTCDYYKLPKIASDRTIRGIGGVKQVEFVLNRTLNLPKLEVKGLDFHVNDYSLLTSVYGLKIDGIIGYSFLKRYIVTLDYDDFTISVYSPGVFRYPRGGYMLKPSFTTLPLQTVTIADGKTVTNKFYFDTGAGLCFLLSEDFEKDSTVLKKNKKLLPTLAEGLGGKRPMQLTVLKSVKVGPYRFRRVPTYLFDDEYNVTAYPSTGGLLGNDLLRRFNIVINYPEQCIHIKPNKAFDSPFDYSYSGFGIYLEDGEIVVDDVIKNSPGEKAGLKAGDKVIAVNGNFSRNIQLYRTMLQNYDNKIRMIVMRDGFATEIVLKVRNLLNKK